VIKQVVYEVLVVLLGPLHTARVLYAAPVGLCSQQVVSGSFRTQTAQNANAASNLQATSVLSCVARACNLLQLSDLTLKDHCCSKIDLQLSAFSFLT
jgi:hypothetical protein